MPIRVGDIVAIVMRETGVTHEELRSGSKERHVTMAKSMVYYLAKRYTSLGWKAIARHSFGQDRSSARALYERLLERASQDGQLAVRLVELERLVVGERPRTIAAR